ncbi:MAG: hypothetical protein KAX78_05475, partial [Phycisphaerae bacterium]|nr:hypothetical protein [Phycisphaerae bacterium]
AVVLGVIGVIGWYVSSRIGKSRSPKSTKSPRSQATTQTGKRNMAAQASGQAKVQQTVVDSGGGSITINQLGSLSEGASGVPKGIGDETDSEKDKDTREPKLSLQAAVRSFRFLRRWITRRMTEAYEFRYSLPSVLRELAQRRGVKTDAETAEHRFVWIAGPTPKGTQTEIDRELADIFSSARLCLEQGTKPIVQAVGIEAHVGRSAVGLELYRGRILWADLQHSLPFWTLRPNEGNRASRVIDALARWLSSVTPPPMDGLSAEEVRDKLFQALYIFRVNPYSHDLSFAMVAAGEMEAAQARADQAECLLNRWMLIRENTE